MIGVTLFGLLLTPVFYVGLRTLSGGKLVQHGEGSRRMVKPASAEPVRRERLQHVHINEYSVGRPSDGRDCPVSRLRKSC